MGVPSFLETLSVYSTGIYRYDTPILYVHVTNSFKLAPQWAYGGWSLAPFHWSPGMKTLLDSDAFLTLLYRSQITVQTAKPRNICLTCWPTCAIAPNLACRQRFHYSKKVSSKWSSWLSLQQRRESRLTASLADIYSSSAPSTISGSKSSPLKQV